MGRADERAPLRAVPPPEGVPALRESVEEVLAHLSLGRMARQWALLLPYDMLEARYPQCSVCALWDRGEEGREASIWVHTQWMAAQTYRFLAAELAVMIEAAPSGSALKRHFAGDGTKGRIPKPPHVGLKPALERRRSEKWMAEAIARSEDEAARIPATFARVGELLVEQAGDALQAGDIVYERPIDIKVAVQTAILLGAGKDDTGGAIGALAQLGRMIEAMRRKGGDELVQSVILEVAQMQARGSSTITVGAARRGFEGDSPVARMQEDGIVPSQQRRRVRPADDQEDDEN